jgi:uncharacterized lipoprotein YddW (UPF0748 family)
MNRLLRSVLAVAGTAALAMPLPAQAPPEMRACWVSRFNWTRDTPEATRERIVSIMENLKASNFNAVLFQVRGECNSLYPSPYEPWGPQFNWTDPGWDPVAFAIEQARANGLEFHAYFNTHTLTAVVPPPETTPQHPYNLHGPESPDSWVIHDRAGNPVASADSYTWLSPSNPNASAWTRKVLMHLVETYDIDGVHFDRIRTPAAGYSFDVRSVQRFEGDGNPMGGEWGDFMRDAITQDLRRIYGAIALRKPHVKITAAPFGICRREPDGYQGTGTQSYYSWYQDSFGWMEQHVVDAIFPMIYWRIGSAHPFEVLLADFLKYTGGRHVYAGIHAGRDPIAQIAETRRQGAPGSTIWSYGSGDFSAYLAGPYSEPAPVPAMPWKENPTVAIVAGTVTSAHGVPLLDAWVRVGDNPATYLSGADGFYTVLDLAPGTHTIHVEKPKFGAITREVTVAAGDVLEVNLQLPGAERAEYMPPASMMLIGEMTALAATDATVLRPEYVAESLKRRTEDAQRHSLFHRALRSGKEADRLELLRAIELQFIHDPKTSTLDLLEPELRDKYRGFAWDPADYPGGPEGPNESVAIEMVEALRLVLPERRANTGPDPVVRRAEATEEVWQYMEDQWAEVPEQTNWKLNRHAVQSFVAMRDQARREGVELVIRSGHRTRARAEAGAAAAGNAYAVASFSSHSLGLAIDFQMSHGELQFAEITTRPMAQVVRMRESPVHKWMFVRGRDFGWYAYMHEPWHWEYNPPGFRQVFWADFPGGAPPDPEPEPAETPAAAASN